MTDRLATTPFGGARFDARTFARQKWIAERQAALSQGEGSNDTGKADKWQLLRALTEARDHYGLSDRSINVLEALLSFHQDREIDGAAPVIVFPSNMELSLRTRGMSPATLRRHLAALVAAGMILRRDSPNGKRYCRRDENGAPGELFGFDLAPIALMAPEIHGKAEAARADHRARQKIRAEITIHLRDIAKTVEAALNEGRAGEWPEYLLQLQALSGRVLRNAELASLETRRDALLRLRAEVENSYLNSLSEQEMSANDSCFEHHNHNSNTDPHTDYSGNEVNTEPTFTPTTDRKRPPAGVTLKRVIAACPQIAYYSRNGVETWEELLAAASLVRSMLGISPSAWDNARRNMGDATASVVIAAMLERTDSIRSAGGYLRTLTEKAGRGEFSVIPMLKALE